MLRGMDAPREPHPPDESGRHLHAVGPATATGHEHAFGAVDPWPDEPSWMAYDPPDDFTRRQLDLFSSLIGIVGGVDALWRLDTVPLPDEPFDWAAVDAATRRSCARWSR